MLQGVHVVELGCGLAGSSCAAILRSLGASVTKLVVEDRKPQAFAPWLRDSSGAPFPILCALLDRHKRTRSGSPDPELFDEADVVLCDRVVDDAGLPADRDAYADYVARYNRSVWVSLTPFGLTGPYSSYLGSELVSSAAGGLAATIAPKDGGRPSLLPGWQGLLATGQVAALAALHGLDRRRATARPVHVDVSSQEAVAMAGALPECAHAIYNCPGRAGSGRYIAPSGLFRCRDGFVRITAPDDHQWAGVVRALDNPAWTHGLDERKSRAEHAERINRELESWTAGLGIAECAERLQAHGVPATPVNTPDDLLASPQFSARGFLETTTLGGETARAPGRPYTWAASRPEPCSAPRQGLRDLRIAEFAHVLAGPIAGALLGAMGAHVVRFEDLARLDLYRRTGPFAHGIAGKERGAYFAVSNHSKRSLAVNVESHPEAAAELVRRSDVVLENFGSTRMARLGVAAETCTAARPDLLFLSVSGFGQSGPLARYRAYANNVHAYGGLSHLTRDANGEPIHVGTVLADPLSSITAATVIAAWALGEGRRGGIVDLSMAEVVADKVAEFIAEASLGATRTLPAGSDRFPYAPHGFHPTVDGRWIGISVHSDDEWRALVDTLGRPQTLSEPDWATACRRWEARRAVESALDEITRNAVADELFHRLQRAGVRACPVWTGADLVHDPHLEAREFFPRIAHPDADLTEARLVGLAWRFVGEPTISLRPPPLLGEYSLEGPAA